MIQEVLDQPVYMVWNRFLKSLVDCWSKASLEKKLDSSTSIRDV